MGLEAAAEPFRTLRCRGRARGRVTFLSTVPGRPRDARLPDLHTALPEPSPCLGASGHRLLRQSEGAKNPRKILSSSDTRLNPDVHSFCSQAGLWAEGRGRAGHLHLRLDTVLSTTWHSLWNIPEHLLERVAA